MYYITLRIRRRSDANKYSANSVLWQDQILISENIFNWKRTLLELQFLFWLWELPCSWLFPPKVWNALILRKLQCIKGSTHLLLDSSIKRWDFDEINCQRYTCLCQNKKHHNTMLTTISPGVSWDKYFRNSHANTINPCNPSITSVCNFTHSDSIK